MTRISVVESIENQIATCVKGLSEKNKQAVLTVVKTISEAEKEAAFERKWAKGIPMEKGFNEVHDYIKTLEWNK